MLHDPIFYSAFLGSCHYIFVSSLLYFSDKLYVSVSFVQLSVYESEGQDLKDTCVMQ